MLIYSNHVWNSLHIGHSLLSFLIFGGIFTNWNESTFQLPCICWECMGGVSWNMPFVVLWFIASLIGQGVPQLLDPQIYLFISIFDIRKMKRANFSKWKLSRLFSDISSEPCMYTNHRGWHIHEIKYTYNLYAAQHSFPCWYDNTLPREYHSI